MVNKITEAFERKFGPKQINYGAILGLKKYFNEQELIEIIENTNFIFGADPNKLILGHAHSIRRYRERNENKESIKKIVQELARDLSI